MPKSVKILAAIFTAITVPSAIFFYLTGSRLTRPAHRKIDKPPKGLNTEDISIASYNEKQIKGWTRKKKFALIERMTPEWRDLAAD